MPAFIIFKIMFKIFDIKKSRNDNMAVEQLEQLGKQIKQKRLSLNMTMDCCAEKAGISRATLWSIEKGASNCSATALFKVMEVLGLSITVNNCETNIVRERATRLNSVEIKKMNKFLIMCIEEYASSVCEPSGVTYRKMKDKGVIEMLKNEYGDLHGYSQSYLNEYISSLMEDSEQ